MNSVLREISNVQGVEGQCRPVDVIALAPAGSELMVTEFVVPRVTVAHPADKRQRAGIRNIFMK
jgi:hypothetical protein